jgi:hypothetical protein
VDIVGSNLAVDTGNLAMLACTVDIVVDIAAHTVCYIGLVWQ